MVRSLCRRVHDDRGVPAVGARRVRIDVQLAGDDNGRVVDCLADAQVIERQITVEATRARTWRYAWGAINDGFALASFAAFPWLDRTSRADAAVGGFASVAIAALTLALPLDVEGGPRSLAQARVVSLPACQRLRFDLTLRAAYGDDEAARVTWPWHALNIVAGVAVGGLVAWLRQPASGLASGLGTAIVGELQLFTQPTGLVAFSHGQ